MLKDTEGEGGSCFMHNTPHVGDRLYILPPKNDFPREENIEHSLLIAGGIGITPILSMARTLHASSALFEVHYVARTWERMAFKEQIEELAGDNAQLYTSEGQPPRKLELAKTLDKLKKGTHIYVCYMSAGQKV